MPVNGHPQKPHRVLIVGGCYAGLAAATNLLDLCERRRPRFNPDAESPQHEVPIEITIVDERDGFYHVIGSPLALASSQYAEKAWVKFSDVSGLQHPAIRTVHGSVTKVDVTTKEATIQTNDGRIVQHSYDYLVAASGLRRVWPVVPQSLTREAYLSGTEAHITSSKSAKHGVVVIGGGAVGIEMAAELKAVEPDIKVTLIHSRDRLLSAEPLPDDFKDETLSLLRSQGVEVITGKRVQSQSQSQTPCPSSTDTTTPLTLTLSDNTTITCSHVINAISKSTPTTSYLPPSLLTPSGLVKIKPTLHFTADPYHFAAGDIAFWSGIKRCGAAMHMGSYCAHNIHQHILSTLPPSTFRRPSSPIIQRERSDSFNDVPDLQGYTPVYKELTEHPPMIGVAIGNTAAAYSPTEGVTSGADVLRYMFGEDLGFSICWGYMRLGEVPAGMMGETKAGPTGLGLNSSEGVPREVEGGGGQSTSPPSLSATSSTSSDSEHEHEHEHDPEPQTPYDASGNAEVTDFEALERRPSSIDTSKIVSELRGLEIENGLEVVGDLKEGHAHKQTIGPTAVAQARA